MSLRAVHLLRKLDPAEWGGTETAMQRLLTGLRGHGVTPVVYCPRLPSPPAADPLQQTGCQVRRFRTFVPVLGLSHERRRQMIAVGGNLMSLDLPWSLWRERDAAVVHTHTLGRLGGIARTLARARKIPLVVSIHGGLLDLPATVRKSFDEAPAGWEWGKIFGWVLRSRQVLDDADAILTCNPREAELLKKQFPQKRVVVQAHGVPMEIYQQDRRAMVRAAFPQIAGRKFLLCVGRIDPIKNQLWLIEQAPEILRRHSDVMLVFAGASCDEPYFQRVTETIRRLGLEKQILLTGGLPPDDPRLIGLMQDAAVVVLTSVSETFGLVLLEAWAAGTAVLSSACSGPRALVENGRNGWLFNLDDPDSFHEPLDRILGNPTMAKQMAAEGARVSRQYSLEAAASRVKRLYEEIIEEKRCAA